jgi:hypothetical protein
MQSRIAATGNFMADSIDAEAGRDSIFELVRVIKKESRGNFDAARKKGRGSVLKGYAWVVKESRD